MTGLSVVEFIRETIEADLAARRLARIPSASRGTYRAGALSDLETGGFIEHRLRLPKRPS